MTLKLVNAALTSFLKEPKPSIVALTGRWGSGKTFYWQQFMKASTGESLPATHYSYVSLFGIQDLATFKDTLFENAERANLNVPAESSEVTVLPATGDTSSPLERIKAIGRRLGFGARKYARLLEEFPGLKEIGPFARSAAFLTVSNYVVCVDDLERHSANLPIKDVLGLLTVLREQRQCRVLVILNDGALVDDELTEFAVLREKVFDYEITFDPLPADCASIVFPEGTGWPAMAAQHSTSLKIQNIRVLSRVRRIIELLHPYVASLDPVVLAQVVHSSVLLVWSYSTKNEGAPPLEYLRRLNYASFVELPPARVLTEEQKEWNAVLESYEYRNTDDLDLFICDTIQRGFVDDEGATRVTALRHDAAVRAGLENALSAAWAIYRSGFGDDEARLVAALRDAGMAAAKWTTLVSLDASVRLLRSLGHDAIANELVDHWVHIQSTSNPAVLDLNEDVWAADVKDERLLDAVKAAHIAHPTDPPLRDVVIGLTERNGWGPADERVLTAASVDELFQLLKALPDDVARPAAKRLLNFGNYGGNPIYQQINERTRAALSRIAAESNLNALRVAALGVTLAPSTDDGERPGT